MKNSNLVISDRRFLKSPFFDCYHHENVLYGVYNNRLYPLSCGYDDQDHYNHLRKYCCLYDVPETPLRISGRDKKEFLERIFTRNIDKIKVGRAVYAFACNHDGGILMDGVLMHPNEDETQSAGRAACCVDVDELASSTSGTVAETSTTGSISPSHL